MNQKGFTSLALGIIIALLFILGGGLYYYIITQEKQSEQYTPQEVFTKEKDVEFNQEMKDKTTEKKLSGDECSALGGEIINTLGDTRKYSENEILGKVIGMRCPCICVKSP